jgi:ABC-type multidrug transport system fused ATPase/permease subunit
MHTPRGNGQPARHLLHRLLRREDASAAQVRPDLVPGPGRLVLAAVSVDPLLHDVTAVAEPATLVAVVGANRAGRSALLSLAAGMVEPDRGRVCLDGQDLALHSPASVRRAIALLRSDDRVPSTGARVLALDEEQFDRAEVDRIIRERGQATVLVGTQRRELVEEADSVWHLDAGRIAESGPPSGLLRADTRTARLFGRT